MRKLENQSLVWDGQFMPLLWITQKLSSLKLWRFTDVWDSPSNAACAKEKYNAKTKNATGDAEELTNQSIWNLNEKKWWGMLFQFSISKNIKLFVLEIFKGGSFGWADVKATKKH